MEGLPSLGETNRVPPGFLQALPARVRRRTSKLPELGRRESIISTYRSELYQPKIVTFMKNGDKFFEGVKVNVSSRNFRHWEVLLSELSRSIDLPAGVRHIYTPENGHRVTTMEQFRHQRAYVCASTEPFKRITYGKAKTPTWHAGTKVRHNIGTLLDLSKSMHGLDRSLIRQSQAVDSSSVPGLKEDGKERKRKRGCVRKLSFRTAQQPASILPEQFPMIKSPPRKQSSITAPPQSEPTPFTIICNGPPPRKIVTVFLDRQCILSWEQARSLISENVQSTNGCLRLYSVDGVEVTSLSQLWTTNGVLISTGHGDFNIADFLQGRNHPTEAAEDGAPTDQQLTLVLPEEVQDTREHLSSVQCSPANFQWNLEQQGVTVSTQQKVETDGGRGEKEGRVEGEEERKEKENEVTENEKERKGHTERKSVICAGRVEVTEPLQSSTVSTLKSPVEERDTSQDQRPSERHPSSRVEPEENQVYPTTSMLTLTEDGSLIGSGSPLTVAKAAAIQHLHRLVAQSALPYDEDNTSGSEGSTYMPFASASRPSVICPQTPQSDLSFSPQQSLVEMNLPKKNGFKSDVSAQSTSTQSSLPKSRTVGIQTDLIGDKLSTVIEEDEQPCGLKRSQRKRKLTHPLFHSRTSIGSQINQSASSVSHRQKDNYTMGSVLGEGRFVVVRECHHKMTGKQYSLRAINKARVFGQEDLIWQECKMLRCMKHENLVMVVDGWESSDDICMVVEHVEGVDLFDAVLHCQHFCEVDVTHAMKQLSMALVYLHAHKIVHRDIKLENIFLHQIGEGKWSLKLGGMGLATMVTEPLSLLCGTTYYMAPEMITETGYGTKLDVWAAGVICHILLSGIMPFGSNSKRATVSNIKRGKYAFLSPFWSEVSDQAKDFVRHLLVVSPHKRYMATQMLQHPWIEREQWEHRERTSELSRALMEHLVSKSSSVKNAALPALIVTALDKRRGLLDVDSSLHRNTQKCKKVS